MKIVSCVFIFYVSGLIAGHDFVSDPLDLFCYYKNELDKVKCSFENMKADSERGELYGRLLESHTNYKETKELIKNCIQADNALKENFAKELDKLDQEFEEFFIEFTSCISRQRIIRPPTPALPSHVETILALNDINSLSAINWRDPVFSPQG